MGSARELAMLATVVGVAGGVARAERVDPTPQLSAERDVLIDKIVRGVDYDVSVRRFAALLKERDLVVATSHEAVERERAQREVERAERDARARWRSEYQKSADYEVSWRCTLSVDPAHPVPSDEGRFRADWGKVVRKESVRLKPKNELDEGEPATLYEVAGARRRYVLHGETAGAARTLPFSAEPGDLVLVCDGGTDLNRHLPPPWDTQMVQRGGFAVRLAAPPLIAQKGRWNPIHITSSRFFWAIKEVKWKYVPGSFVLSNIEIAADLGGGRYRVDAGQGLDWVLEVPPPLKRDLLVPGHSVWAILGTPRFDRALKKLVLVAEDLEARYIQQR